MPKKKTTKPHREMTHRQLTHWQKEKRLQRITLIAGIVVIAAIIVVVGVGLYASKYKPLHQTVLKIGASEYDMNYLIETLASLGIGEADPGYESMYVSFALQTIKQNDFIVKAAASGFDNIAAVTVSDAEVMKYIKEQKLSKDKSRQDTVRRQLVTDKLKSEVFSPQIPATAEHRAVWVMLLESQTQASEIKSRVDKGEKFADIASQLSLDSTTKDKKGDLGWLPEGVLSSVLNNINSTSTTLLESKIFDESVVKNQLNTLEDITLVKEMGYWLVKVTETQSQDNQAHLFAMLLGSRQQAEDIKTKLSSGGEGNDWATLAKANSQYGDPQTDNGDLGFKSKGSMGDVVDAAVFSEDGKVILSKDAISGPLADPAQSTNGAVWLFQVNGMEVQTTSDANRTTLIDAKLSTWFEKYWEANKDTITDSLTPEQQQYAVQQAVKR